MNTTEPAGLPVHPKYGSIQAFTLSPNPKYYRSYDPVAQYVQLLNCLFKRKQLKNTLSHYVFVPELNQNGNVHIHGMYYIKNKYSYHRWFLPACKHWGFTLVKNKNINNKWVEYLYKDLSDNRDILYCDEHGQRLPVPITKKTLSKYIYVVDRPHTRNQLSMVSMKKPKKTKITDYF